MIWEYYFSVCAVYTFTKFKSDIDEVHFFQICLYKFFNHLRYFSVLLQLQTLRTSLWYKLTSLNYSICLIAGSLIHFCSVNPAIITFLDPWVHCGIIQTLAMLDDLYLCPVWSHLFRLKKKQTLISNCRHVLFCSWND